MRILKIIVIFLFIVHGFDSIGQKIVYLNSSFEKSPRSKATHVARIIRPHKDSLYEVDIRTYPEGKIYAKEKTRKKSASVKYAEGPVTVYYPDGVVRNFSVFSNGNILHQVNYYPSGKIKNEQYYKDANKDGPYLEFNIYGDTSCVSHYLNDTLNGIYRLFFLNNKISTVLHYQMGKKHGVTQKYFAPDTLDYSGQYVNNMRSGIWRYHHKNGQLASKEVYEDDKIISAELFDEEGSHITPPDSLHWLDAWPTYVGGEKVLQKDLSKNLIYPSDARLNNIEGTVYVDVEINKQGQVVSKKVLRSPDSSLSEASLEAVGKLGRFDPGMNHNRTHNVNLVIPIKFRLP